MTSIAGTMERSSFAHAVPARGAVQRVVHAAMRLLSRRRTERALAGLSDHVLKDIGVPRGEIGSIADLVASGRRDATRLPRLHRNAAWL